ncbi:MAG: glycosyltransferase family 2 protein [Actinobacteria bacterium]|nr:glycosyltransferase family 2 protein [Actinomycetota bacterium]
MTSVVGTPDHWFNWYLAVAWSFYAPLSLVGIAGAVHLHREGRGCIRRSDSSVTTDAKVVFTVPSLCRANTTNALRRVINSITEHAPKNLNSWRVDVVTEEPSADNGILAEWSRWSHVRVLVVPSSYQTAHDAKYKTRANQFAMEQRRRDGENDASTYVYHLDDDTHVGPDTVASLAEFIETHRNCHYLAQGTLTFPRELAPSRLAWYCDAIRPADDLSRFAFFTGKLGRPLAGLHGEHVIIRGDIEDEIGWDYRDTVIEDAYFALEFARRYPGRSTTLTSFSTKLPLFYAVMCWTLAPFQFVPFMVAIGLALGVPTVPPQSWIFGLWSISVSTLMWQYSQGVKVNMMASRFPGRTWWRSALCVPGLYLFAGIETCGAVLGIIRFVGIGRQRESEAIAKPL